MLLYAESGIQQNIPEALNLDTVTGEHPNLNAVKMYYKMYKYV